MYSLLVLFSNVVVFFKTESIQEIIAVISAGGCVTTMTLLIFIRHNCFIYFLVECAWNVQLVCFLDVDAQLGHFKMF